MGFGRYSFLICFFTLLVSPVLANECSKEDKEYADFWQNYYTLEDAYAFGLKVQSLVSNEDLSGIFFAGPRRITKWSKKGICCKQDLQRSL